MMRKIVVMAILCLSCLAPKLPAVDASTALNVTVQPEHILIGAGYNGKHVSITGKIPSGATSLIRVMSKPEHYKLKQKGRALGFLWMNLGSIEISKVPGVFLVYRSGGDQKQTDQQASQELSLGLEGLRKQADIAANDGDVDILFDEYVKLKEKSGLYDVVDNAINYGPDGAGMKTFNALLRLPSALPPGTYDIEVFAIKDGIIDDPVVKKIDARAVGTPAWISNLAYNHGILYGVLAVLVAVIAGLLTGTLFKGAKGAH
jgi:uncharacterized protein (TIGR02186 family)